MPEQTMSMVEKVARAIDPECFDPEVARFYDWAKDRQQLARRSAERAIDAIGGWRPIETAPKDGTRFLAAYSDGRVVQAFYLDNSATKWPWAGVRPANSMETVKPGVHFTGWRPMPSPPLSAAALKEGDEHEFE